MEAHESSIGSGQTVADVMLASPKALPADSSVRVVREHFENPKVQLALLVEGEVFRGALTREDLEAAARPDEPARLYAQTGSPVAPDASADELFEQMTASGTRRRVVLEPDGEKLVGLLCLNARGTGFCSSPGSTDAHR